MKQIHDHFKSVDPVLAEALELIGEIPPVTKKGDNRDHFTALCESIVSQQLSVKVADVIWKRFTTLMQEDVSPVLVVQTPDQLLRDQGLSWAKIKYVKDLAQKVIDKELLLEELESLDNEAVIIALTKVKGIGRWTAEMFLMFALDRPDVFSMGDLGLKRAIQKLYSLDHEPNESELLELTSKWSPYRTYASRILWRTLDNEPKR